MTIRPSRKIVYRVFGRSDAAFPTSVEDHNLLSRFYLSPATSNYHSSNLATNNRYAMMSSQNLLDFHQRPNIPTKTFLCFVRSHLSAYRASYSETLTLNCA